MFRQKNLMVTHALFMLTAGVAHAATLDADSVAASYLAGVTSEYTATTTTAVAAPPAICAGAMAVDVDCGTSYQHKFNVQDANANQGDLTLNPANSFTSGGTAFNLAVAATNVAIKRVTTTGVARSDAAGIHYESASITALGVDPHIAELVASRAGNSIASTPLAVLQDQVINNGLESLFDNRFLYGERLDLFFGISGVATPTPSNAGFLILERAGNDSIKVAAITSISSGGEPTEYGPLVSVAVADWVDQGFTVITRIFSSYDGANKYALRGLNGSQEIKGVFLSLADLGVAADVPVYGYSIFGPDVDGTHVLTDPETFPLDTDAAGGLDLLYASGLFDSDAKVQVLFPAAVPVLGPVALLLLCLSLIGLYRASKHRYS